MQLSSRNDASHNDNGGARSDKADSLCLCGFTAVENNYSATLVKKLHGKCLYRERMK